MKIEIKNRWNGTVGDRVQLTKECLGIPAGATGSVVKIILGDNMTCADYAYVFLDKAGVTLYFETGLLEQEEL